MERNLNMRNNFPFLPSLEGVSAKTGPLESNLITIMVKIIIGKNRIKRISERIMSKILFTKS